MKPLTVVLAFYPILFTPIVRGHSNGLIGYGQWWYDPACAYACRAVISSAILYCPADSSSSDEDESMGMDMDMSSPSANCISENLSFLSTLAYCIDTRCSADGVSVSKIEAYWADQATGDATVPAQWTYGAVLANITQPPTQTFESGDTLNYTAIISNTDYEFQFNFDRLFDWEEMVQSTYAIVIITVGVATPVLITLLGYLPFMHNIFEKLKMYLVYPSTIGTYSVRPLPYSLGYAPTIGQSLFIGMFTVLNVILGAVTYKGSGRTDPWGFTRTEEILAFVGYRTGHISYALLPLTVLFSSRNNILLWVTNWPFSTFLVLHRWVARLCTIHAIIHSITLLATYMGTGTYYADVHKPYWIWGIVALLCLIILLAQSVAWFRRASYEVFLMLHIFLAVFTIAGCWYHVYYWKGLTGIYELWIYMVSAVWFFDRLIRILRILRNGLRRARVTELSSDTVRVDIEGLRLVARPGYHAYIYFPSLRPVRFWENHPFSVTFTSSLRSNDYYIESPNDLPNGDLANAEKANKALKTTVRQEVFSADKITIYIKKGDGMTSLLKNHSSLPVLIDGPYRGNSSDEILKCDRVLLIGGGVGITGLLSWINAHANVKIAWSVKSAAESFVQDVTPALSSVVEKDILIGKRMDVNALLAQEIQSGWKRIGVVVCGPGGLCDAVRAAVVAAGRKEQTIFELEVDAFSW